jgi:predicted RNA-binding Zn ribbon-like protein
MRLSEKYAVPVELALLYDFVNTLDQRRYVEDGAALAGGDQIEDPRRLEAWMRDRGLLHRGEKVDVGKHRAALQLRAALRDFLRNPPEHRARAREQARQLTAISGKFPLTLAVSAEGEVELVHSPDSTALARVLGQLFRLAETGQLARLKTCASEDCRWIFFDRSKPANRHWCSSSGCGNRHKTRAWRLRQRQALIER